MDSKKINKERGFTILELLITLGIVSILTAIALPINSELIDSSNRNLALRTFTSDLSKAQSRAIDSGSRVIFTSLNNGQSYNYGIDVFPYNLNFTADTIENVRTLPSNSSINFGTEIIFDPRGMVINTSELLISKTITFTQNSHQFKSVTLYPTGVVD